MHDQPPIQNVGLNQLNYTEVNQAYRLGQQPPPLPRVIWERWPLRWLASFCFGVGLANLIHLVDAVAQLLITIAVLLALIWLIGWGLWEKTQQLPASIACLSWITGAAIAALLLIPMRC